MSVLPSLSSLSTSEAAVLRPYINIPSFIEHHAGFPVAYCILEVAFLSLAFVLFLHARASGRVHVFVACMAFGLGMETLGFIVRSHAHGQFVLQVTSYLPLKEDLWYVLTLYPALVMGQLVFGSIQQQEQSRTGGNSKSYIWEKALLVAVLGIVQDVPYEFVNSRPGVDVVYVNHEDFKLGDLSELINGGSATVILSYTLCSLSFGLILPNLDKNASVISGFLAGLFTCVVACVIQTPFHLLKYIGCRSLLPLLFSDGWFAFHSECLCKSAVSTSACLVLMAVVFIGVLLKSLWAHARTIKTNSSNLALYISAIGCHVTFIILLLLADEFDAFCLAVLLVNMAFHLCLMAWLEARYGNMVDGKTD